MDSERILSSEILEHEHYVPSHLSHMRILFIGSFTFHAYHVKQSTILLHVAFQCLNHLWDNIIAHTGSILVSGLILSVSLTR